MTNPHESIKNVTNTFPLSDIYFRISQFIDGPARALAKLAEVVTYDSGLTVRVLKLASSVYYDYGPTARARWWRRRWRRRWRRQ